MICAHHPVHPQRYVLTVCCIQVFVTGDLRQSSFHPHIAFIATDYTQMMLSAR